MSEKHKLVLLIAEEAEQAEAVREGLSRGGHDLFRLQCIRSLPMALARIAGGGVDAVVLEIAAGGGGEVKALDAVRHLRASGLNAPMVVLALAADQDLALRAIRAGASDHVTKESCRDTLGLVLQSALERDPRRTPAGPGGVIALMGAKGGVGATTVALNVAYLLAQSGRVILAEMHPDFGSLGSYFGPHGLARNMTHALKGDPAAACLWSSKSMPGLSVLFGPQSAADCGPLAVDRTRQLIRTLATQADYVVMDLPPSLSDANRAMIETSGSVVLVVERDPVCAQSGRLMAQAIESWNGAPQPIEVVLVNRAALVSPMALADIDSQLGRSPLGVIPPAPDLCATAQNVHMPVAALQPDSLIAGSFLELSAKLKSSAVAPVPPRDSGRSLQHA